MKIKSLFLGILCFLSCFVTKADWPLNSTVWNTSTPFSDSQMVFNNDGSVVFLNRGILISKSAFPVSYELDGSFQFFGNVNDQFHIYLRSDGVLGSPSKNFLHCIDVSFGGGEVSLNTPNNIKITDSIGIPFVQTTFNFFPNISYNFRLIDNGDSITLYLNNPLVPFLILKTSKSYGNLTGIANNRGTAGGGLAGENLGVKLILNSTSGFDTNFIYVSSRSSANYIQTGFILGSGSITNPFWGDFDTIINAQPTNTVIHLLPGTFISEGYNYHFPNYIVLKAGQKIKGSGIDVTIVKRNPNTILTDNFIIEGILYSKDDSVEVSDLTVDAQGSLTFLGKVQGVGLWGNYCTISHVKVINTSGHLATGEECFSIDIGLGNLNNNSWTNIGNTISDCIIYADSSVSSYTSAILANGTTIVRNNKIYCTPPTSSPSLYLFQGLTGGGFKNSLFEGNYIYGAGNGFYSDTGSMTNLNIINNFFDNVINGIFYPPVPNPSYAIDGLMIRNNFIEENTNYFSSARLLIGIINSGASQWRRISIIGNSLRFRDNHGFIPEGNQAAFGILSTINSNITGVQIIGNVVDKAFYNALQGEGYYISGNVDLDGALLNGNGFTNSPTINPLQSYQPTWASIGYSTNVVIMWSSNNIPPTVYKSYFDAIGIRHDSIAF